MTTYKDAGVDTEAGDKASKSAYETAAATFASRKGMIGEPVFEEGNFGGLLDMGDHYLVQSTDGTGTKIDAAYQAGRLEGLGYDLLAMVADDIVCTGAEVISLSNCIDVAKVNADEIETLLSSLSAACAEQRIVIPAGEIAEVPGAVTRAVWSATGIGIVKKDRIPNPKSVTEGDAVIALQSGVARCNGLSLIRKILGDTYGEYWHGREWNDGITWGEIILTPSIVYHDAILSLIGRFHQEPLLNVKAVAHITGGGIPSKFRRALRPSGLGAVLDGLWPPHDAITGIMELGSVTDEEAYRTWNMGNGMLLIVDPSDAGACIDMLGSRDVHARRAGTICKNPDINIHAFSGAKLRFGPTD